jgi:predicted DCC family thiol-disulfide oxidoreductase YuxK
MATVAIYDGRCVICNTTRRIVGFLDWMKRVEFLDLHQQGEVEARYPQINHEEAMGQIHVVADGGKVYEGFDGTRRMLRDLPLGLPLWALLHLPIVGTWLGPNLYKFIARNRYTINRLLGVDLEKAENDCIDGVCKIPTAKKG